LMVEGDKWELYIPSELGYGDRGSPPKIGGGDALIFVMEMIEIMGEKVVATRCDVDTLEGCTDKEKGYVEKAKGKFDGAKAIAHEMDRIGRISQHGSQNTIDWANARLKILGQLSLTAAVEL